MNTKHSLGASFPKFFSVYLTRWGLELRPGCNDVDGCHALHTSRSYQMAFEFAQASAVIRQAHLKDLVRGMNVHWLEL